MVIIRIAESPFYSWIFQRERGLGLYRDITGYIYPKRICRTEISRDNGEKNARPFFCLK